MVRDCASTRYKPPKFCSRLAYGAASRYCTKALWPTYPRPDGVKRSCNGFSSGIGDLYLFGLVLGETSSHIRCVITHNYMGQGSEDVEQQDLDLGVTAPRAVPIR